MSQSDSATLAQSSHGVLAAAAAAAQTSALAPKLGNMTPGLSGAEMATKGLLSRLDAVSLILLVATIIAFLVPIFILFPPIPVDRSDALRQTHSRAGLPPRRSNLRHQMSPEHGAKDGQPPRVQSLYIYPVKSCQGIELQRSKVLPTGLEHDRLYTFAHLKTPTTRPGTKPENYQPAPTWEFLTQRQLPLLANVKVNLWVPDPNKISRQLGRVDDAFLIVRFPWKDRGIKGVTQWLVAKMSRGWRGVPEKEFMLPIAFPSAEDIKERGYTFADVKIWKEVTTALNYEKEVPAELAQYLGAKNRMGLFRMDPSRQREVFRCAKSKEALGYQPIVDFHDAYPLHMLSLTSMQALDSKVVKDEMMKNLDARRFRANIIISGSEEYEEDSWKTLHLTDKLTKEECHLDASCRTVRCKLPNVDPDTGIRHKAEPDRALRKFRDVDEGAPKMGCMGMQLCPMFPDAKSAGMLQSYIEVGMDIDVKQRAYHVYIEQ